MRRGLGYIRATDLPLVGGKGANLGEMTNADFPIPAGFCGTTMTFAQFIAGYAEAQSLYAQLDTVSADIESARRVGKQIRGTFLTAPMPPAVTDAVRNA